MRFPIRYLQNAVDCHKAFRDRATFKWPQLLAIWFLLTAIFMCPMAYLMARHPRVRLDDYQERVMQLVDHQTLSQLSHLRLNDQGHLQVTEEQVIEKDKGRVLITQHLSEKKLPQNKPALIFTPTAFIMKEPKKPSTRVAYLTDNQMVKQRTVNGLKAELSRMWFETNRVSLLMARLVTVWLLILTNFTVMILGAGALISLMRLSPSIDIRTIKEGVTLVTEAMFWPTFLSMVVGFVTLNPSLLFITLTSGLVIVLLTMFWKTHFNENYLTHKGVYSKWQKTPQKKC